MLRHRFTVLEIEEIRTVLFDHKRLLTERVERLSEDSVHGNPSEQGETSSIPTHQADLGTETFEQDKAIGLAERTATETQAIDDALERIDSGIYGICEQCRKRIQPERLQALPSALRCTRCQAEQEAA
jgi:RNA polymerase-binding transcription factor DksA